MEFRPTAFALVVPVGGSGEGLLHKIVHEFGPNGAHNYTIQYYIGQSAGGSFMPIGAGTVQVHNRAAIVDPETGEVIEPEDMAADRLAEMASTMGDAAAEAALMAAVGAAVGAA